MGDYDVQQMERMMEQPIPEEFKYKLSDINKRHRKDGLPEVGREQCRFLMGKQKQRKGKQNRVYVDTMEEGVHYIDVGKGVYSKYEFSNEGVRFCYRWAIARNDYLKEKKR